MLLPDAETPDHLTRPYDRNLGKGPAPVFPEIGLSDQVQRTQHLLSGRVHPFPVEADVPKGIRALRDFRAALRPASRDEGAELEARLCAAMKNGPSPGDNVTVAKRSVGKLALQVGLGAGLHTGRDDMRSRCGFRCLDELVYRCRNVFRLIGS